MRLEVPQRRRQPGRPLPRPIAGWTAATAGTPPHRVLIVGGVAGGASCAARARRVSETAEIVMFERGQGRYPMDGVRDALPE